MSAKEKICEFCGKISTDYFYKFIADINYLILLKNIDIKFNNKEERYVVLSNGTKVDYSLQVSSEQAISFSDIIPHIFCSESCVDEFLLKYSHYLLDDLYLKTPILNYMEMDMFCPIVFPINAFGENYDICNLCGKKYPNHQHVCIIKRYSKFKKISGKLGINPLMSKKYDIAFSDIHERQSKGNFYLYKFVSLDREMNFCSNECIFEYCSNMNSVATFKSNIEKASIRAITPHLIEINKSLNNKYLFRPLFVTHLPRSKKLTN